MSLTVPKIRTRTSPAEDEHGAVQFDEVDVVERTGRVVGVPGEQVCHEGRRGSTSRGIYAADVGTEVRV